MLVNTSTLIDLALDWAVSLITNPDWEHDDRLTNVQGYDEDAYSPSTDWAQGGPIIEQEMIELSSWGLNDCWMAKATDYSNRPGNDEVFAECYGPTPLIAACRCFVASKLGDTVEIPDELL